jgi:hypothetical protein
MQIQPQWVWHYDVLERKFLERNYYLRSSRRNAEIDAVTYLETSIVLLLQ